MNPKNPKKLHVFIGNINIFRFSKNEENGVKENKSRIKTG